MQDAPATCEARLLVVDDEPTILELLSGSLRFAGFDVLTAASGAEALRAAAAARAGPDPARRHDARTATASSVVRRIRAGRAAMPGDLPDRPRTASTTGSPG